MSAKVLIGMQMGCSTGPLPEHYTDEQLSRIHDAVAAIRSVFGVKSGIVSLVFAQLPVALRLEYNYCNWKYVPPSDSAEHQSMSPVLPSVLQRPKGMSLSVERVLKAAIDGIRWYDDRYDALNTDVDVEVIVGNLEILKNAIQR